MRLFAALWLAGSWLAACAPHLPPDFEPVSRVGYATEDGWTAAVRHFPGEGPPVLLVHGMAANHYNWDYRSDLSFVRYLQERGWDVWVAELRGDPESVAPSPRAGRRYTLDDHARLDLPRVLDVITAQTGHSQVYWVGHSMGGMLLYTALELYPERLVAGVALDSPASLVDRDGLLGLGRTMGFAAPRRGVLPVRGLARKTAWMGRHNALFRVVANPDNLDWPLANGLAREALEPVPSAMGRQVVTWLRSGEVLQVDGEPWFDRTRTDRLPVPLLVTGGAVDRIVPPDNSRAACDIFPTCRFVLLGTAGGFSVDYGHVDPVVGRTAEAEVFPLVEGFLREARAAREGAPTGVPVTAAPDAAPAP
jgi:pimeloyl-ACP methyl ester carboxylesterase